MRSSFYALVAALFFIPGIGASQEIAEPFKVGTFDINGKPGVGVVLRDRLILELDAANAALEENPSYPHVPMPDDMIGLIERYEYGLKRRLYEIVNVHVRNEWLDASYVHELGDVITLPPIMYPG